MFVRLSVAKRFRSFRMIEGSESWSESSGHSGSGIASVTFSRGRLREKTAIPYSSDLIS